MDRGTWWATVHGVAKNQNDWVTDTFTFIYIEEFNLYRIFELAFYFTDNSATISKPKISQDCEIMYLDISLNPALRAHLYYKGLVVCYKTFSLGLQLLIKRI